MAEYIPSPADWVAKQVELYESSGGTEGTTLRETGLPVVLLTMTGHKTGAVRKVPLMRVVSDDRYIAVASKGGAPEHPVWYENLRNNPEITLRDRTEVMQVRAREVSDPAERARIWTDAVAAFPPYADYQVKTERQIPVFVLEPV
jgi:deazaflavin-dependent oxidoreductase (nitroreductase family)